jgi:hypothetical protein
VYPGRCPGLRCLAPLGLRGADGRFVRQRNLCEASLEVVGYQKFRQMVLHFAWKWGQEQLLTNTGQLQGN